MILGPAKMTVLTVILINPFCSAGDQTQVITNVKGHFTSELHALFSNLLKICSVHGRKILNITLPAWAAVVLEFQVCSIVPVVLGVCNLGKHPTN